MRPECWMTPGFWAFFRPELRATWGKISGPGNCAIRARA
jgi:hypothetical protein